MIKIGNADTSKILLGDQETKAVYIGSTLLYLKTVSPTAFFCKIKLNNDSIVEINGSGELTKEMVLDYKNTAVEVYTGDYCTSIGSLAFFGFNKYLTTVIIGEGVTSLANQALNACNKVNYIDLPSTLTSIGNYTFHNMSSQFTIWLVMRAITPPSRLNNNLFDSNYLTIFVPDDSVTLYQETWVNQASKITGISNLLVNAE